MGQAPGVLQTGPLELFSFPWKFFLMLDEKFSSFLCGNFGKCPIFFYFLPKWKVVSDIFGKITVAEPKATCNCNNKLSLARSISSVIAHALFKKFYSMLFGIKTHIWVCISNMGCLSTIIWYNTLGHFVKWRLL